MDSNLQNKTDLLLGNRDVLFDLLEEGVGDMLDMSPSYIQPLERVVRSLHLTDEDLSLLSSFDTQKSYVSYIEDVQNLIRMRSDELSRVQLQYDISLRTYLNNAIATPELYNLDESYLDKIKKVSGVPAATRSRSATAASKISLNELTEEKRDKAFSEVGRDLHAWKLVSGNRSPLEAQSSNNNSNKCSSTDNDGTSLLKPHVPKVGGKVLSISFKPVKWQKITQNKNVRVKADNIRRTAKARRHVVDINEHKASGAERNPDGEIQFLRKILLFSIFSDEEIAAIKLEMKIEVFAAGTVVIDRAAAAAGADEDAEKLYVILDGIIGQQNAQGEIVRSLQRGEVLGEAQLAPPSNIAATSTANSFKYSYSYASLNEVTVISVPVSTMDRALASNALYKLIVGCTAPVDAYELSTEMTSLINHAEHFIDFLITFIHANEERLRFARDNRESSSSSSAIAATVLGEDMQDVYLATKVEAKKDILLNFFGLCSPEYTFQDTIRDIICLTRDFFEVDRAGFFFLDKLKNTMVLYGTQIDGPGVELPIKGIAGYIAQNATVINLKDCYDDDIFDASMDKRTGYRTKQMLCAPAHDTRNNVGGVIQLINTLDDRVFSESDENFAILFAELIGDRIQFMKSGSSSASSDSSINMSPAYAIKDAFRIKLVDLVSFKSHNHIKCTTKIFNGSVQLGNTHSTDLFDSRPCDDGPNRITAMDSWIEFPELPYSQLPLSSRIFFQFFSKNNHPVGWTGLPLYDYKRSLRVGVVRLRMFEGAYPQPYPLHSMENYGDANAQLLTLSLRPFDSTVIYEPEFSKSVSSFFSASASSAEWYLQRMSVIEKGRLGDITSGNPHLLSLSPSDKDLLWRMRTAFKMDHRLLPWYLLAVDWAQPDAAAIGYQLVKTWASPSAALDSSLLYLSHLFSDPRIRSFGVSQLKSIDDFALEGLLVSLVQCLRYDLHDDSALGRQLLRRSISSPSVGLKVYWAMRGEAAGNRQLSRRYDVVSEVYIRACNLALRTSMQREFLVLSLIDMAGRIVLSSEGNQGGLLGSLAGPSAASMSQDKRRKLLEVIAEHPFPESFTLHFFPDIVFGRFVFDAFRVVEREKDTTGGTTRSCCLAFEVAGDSSLIKVIESSSLVVRVDDKPSVSAAEAAATAAAAAAAASSDSGDRTGSSVVKITYSIGSNGKREQCTLQFFRAIDVILTAEGFRSSYMSTSAAVQLLSEDSYVVLKAQKFKSLNSISNDSLDNLQLFLGLDSSSESSSSAVPSASKVVRFSLGSRKYFNNILWNYLYTSSSATGGVAGGARGRRSRATKNSGKGSSSSSGSTTTNSFDSIRERFVSSFLFHSVVSYVLGGVDARDGDNCLYAPSGDMMFSDVAFAIKRNTSPPGKSKNIAIYLPLYSQLLGMGDPSAYVDHVEHLSEMFMCLRKNARQLESIMAVPIRNCGLTDAEAKEALECLHENLLPHLSDADAEKAFRSSVVMK